MTINVQMGAYFKYESNEEGNDYVIKMEGHQMVKFKDVKEHNYEPLISVEGVLHLGFLEGVKRVYLPKTPFALTFVVDDAPSGNYEIRGSIRIDTNNEAKEARRTYPKLAGEDNKSAHKA